MRRALLAMAALGLGCTGDFPALEVVVRFDGAIVDDDVARVTTIDATLTRARVHPVERSFDVDGADFEDRQANFFEEVEDEQGTVDIVVEAFAGAEPVAYGEGLDVPWEPGRTVVILSPCSEACP